MKSHLPIASPATAPPEGAWRQGRGTPEALGHYRLWEPLGRGGMGTVYRATHIRLKRSVAVKLLRADRIEHRSSIARFRREMEAVGRLDHRNLVRAYDAGEVEGRHFLAMELVVGADLRQLVDRVGPLGVADACEVIRQSARGLQHAHEHGLVHRDVKPSNIMVARDGTVKLLDLGLARLSGTDTHESHHTVSDQLLGSGDYLAPEQGEDPHQADAQSDLYSLGCTLYFLLAGRAPFDDARHNTFGRKLLAHANEPVPSIGQFRPDLPRGLVLLLARMLAKRPAERPSGMAEVEQALAAWAAGSELSALAVRVPKQERGSSVEADTPVHGAFDETGRNRQRPLHAPAPRPTGRPRYRVGRKLVAAGLGSLTIALAMTLLPTTTRVDAPEPQPLSVAALVRQPAPLPGASGWTIETRGGRATVTCLSLSPDERLLAAGDAVGGIRILRTATADLVHLFVEPEPIRAVAWLSCGRRLASAAGSLRLWDVETGQKLWEATLPQGAAATALDCGPAGRLASGHRNGEIRLWSVPDGQFVEVISGHATAVTAIRFSSDGTRLASGDEGRTICLWSMPDATPLERFNNAEPGPIRRLAWSPDATRLASCGGGPHVTLWDSTDGFRPRKENAANQPVGDLGWAQDGSRFFSVSGGEQGMEFSVLWDGDVRQRVHRPLMAPNAATAMAWSRDAKTVYCGRRDGELVTYHTDSAEVKVLRRAAATRITAMAWAPVGPRVLLGDCAGFSRVWNTDQVGQVLAIRTALHPVSVLAWAPGGKSFAAGHQDGTLVVVDASTGAMEPRLACRGHVFDVAFSPDGRCFATAEEHGLCRLWDAASGDELLQFPLESPSVVNTVAWSPYGRYLAFSAWDGRIRIADIELGTVVADWDSGQGCVWLMLWEPDGETLLTSGSHGGIACWKAPEGVLVQRRHGCLSQAGYQSNALKSLRGFCASGRLRRISPDGILQVRSQEGCVVGLHNTGADEVRHVLMPMRAGHWLALNPATGHYQADWDSLETPVYVVATSSAQENYTPADFSSRYGLVKE